MDTAREILLKSIFITAVLATAAGVIYSTDAAVAVSAGGVIAAANFRLFFKQLHAAFNPDAVNDAIRVLKKQTDRQSMDGLPKLRRLKAKLFERLGRIHFGQAAAEKVPDGLFQQPVGKKSVIISAFLRYAMIGIVAFIVIKTGIPPIFFLVGLSAVVAAIFFSYKSLREAGKSAL